MQDIEIVPRAGTGGVERRHASWVEMEVVAAGLGVIAVFKPTEEEIERGEADLVAEYLRRRAEEFRDELGRVRRAFRTAMEEAVPPLLLYPFFATVRVDDSLEGRRPSLEMAVVVLGVGVAIGAGGAMLGGEGSVVQSISLWASLVVMAYAAVGGGMSSRYEDRFAKTIGLPVALRKAEDLNDERRNLPGRHEGPYEAAAEVVIDRRGEDYALIPRVVVWDRAGDVVEEFLPQDETKPELEAQILLRKGRALASSLNQREFEAYRITDSDPGLAGPENGT